MYKMLIADDDYITLEGLRDLIDWSAMGIAIAGEAEDGKQALDAAMAIRPDILLTDVVMPIMNGIELVECIRQELPDLMVVMISGHQDVGYLKSAMKLDAVDYILKPFNLMELQVVMQKVIRKLESQYRGRRLQREVEYFGSSIPVVASPDVREMLEQIVAVFGSGQLLALEAAVRSFFQTIREKKMTSILFLTAICAELLTKTARNVSAKKALEGMEELAKSYQHVEISRDSFQLEELVLRKLLEMESILQASRGGKTKRLVKEVESLIQQKYNQALTIQQIANEVYVSPSYLQSLFKKETGQTMNDYMTFVRIEKAKELLKDPAVKVYEVAYQVGYQDTHYFSKIFKKLVGLNPLDYR